MSKKTSLYRAAHIFKQVLESPKTYIGVVALFALQLIYLAFIMNYPALFDEEYHLGIIEIYSRNVSPFITVQPDEAAFHGDITRYGSYLFHYLMSFPYALLGSVTSDIKSQVIVMRLICISFVIAGVYMWRRFLLQNGVSNSVVTVVTFFFAMIPLVNLALAQINYDSLGFLIIPSILYVATRSIQEKNRQVLWLAILVILALLGSLVKFTILPIAFVAVCVALFYAVHTHKKNILKIYKKQFMKLPTMKRVGLAVILLCAIGLFVERYGVNIVTYKNIEPKCDQVHSRESCMNYTVYRRDTTWRESNEKKQTPRDSAYTYTTEYWAPHIFNDFFVVGALVTENEQGLTLRYLPEKISANGGVNTLRIAGWTFFALSIFLIAVRTPYLWKRYKTLYILLIGVLVVYTIALWTRNYTDYLKIGAGTAAQGRYYIPLLIGIFTLAALSMGSILNRLRYKAILLVVGLLLLSQGGGLSTYILRSKDSWYWADQRSTISHLHQNAKKFLRLYIRS